MLMCIFGKHKYSYIGNKSGMVMGPGRTVIGTERKLYECVSCGKRKPAENKDYE